MVVLSNCCNYDHSYIMTDYEEQLQDPRWKEKADFIKKRDKMRCRMCTLTGYPREVHHLYYESTYDRPRNPWEYPDNTMITVCVKCHKEHHRKNKNKYLKWHEILMESERIGDNMDHFVMPEWLSDI